VVDEEGTKQPNAGPVFVLDDTEFPAAFGELVNQGYASLFELYGDPAWQLDKGKLTGFFRTSDQTSARVGEQQAATFIALASLAGHPPVTGNGNGSTPRNRTTRLSGETRVKPSTKRATQTTTRPELQLTPPPARSSSPLAMSVRIELNLPISDKQEVYDNIFGASART
jgi:hypothetical protein